MLGPAMHKMLFTKALWVSRRLAILLQQEDDLDLTLGRHVRGVLARNLDVVFRLAAHNLEAVLKEHLRLDMSASRSDHGRGFVMCPHLTRECGVLVIGTEWQGIQQRFSNQLSGYTLLLWER